MIYKTRGVTNSSGYLHVMDSKPAVIKYQSTFRSLPDDKKYDLFYVVMRTKNFNISYSMCLCIYAYWKLYSVFYEYYIPKLIKTFM